MVHALSEIRRVLKPNATLIDLRPVEDNWSVEVVDSADWQAAGRLNDMPIGVEDDAAAFAAMREVQSRGWYSKEKEEEFAFFYYWDTPSEMKEFIEEEWGDFKKMDDDLYHKARSMWTVANGDARVRVRVKMLITQWKQRESS